MTSNQLQYWANQEMIRSNKAKESETARSNLAKEGETQRTNLANEKLRMLEYKEQKRYNKNKNATDYMKASADIVKAGTGVAELFM